MITVVSNQDKKAAIHLDCVLCIRHGGYECHHPAINTEMSAKLRHPPTIKVPKCHEIFAHQLSQQALQEECQISLHVADVELLHIWTKLVA